VNKTIYSAGGNSDMLTYKTKDRDDKIEEIIGNNDDN
jgi:hypothetical protein